MSTPPPRSSRDGRRTGRYGRHRRFLVHLVAVGLATTGLVVAPAVELPWGGELARTDIPLALSPAAATGDGVGGEADGSDPDEAASPPGPRDAATPLVPSDEAVPDAGPPDEPAPDRPVEPGPAETLATTAPPEGHDEADPDEPAAEAGPGELTTGLQTTDDFDVMGVTWAASDLDEVESVQVRLRQDGEWGAWQAVGIEAEAPDPGTREYQRSLASGTVATEPVVAAGADGFEVRLATEDGEAPEDLEAVTIDAPRAGAEADILPLESAQAGMLPRPAIVTRAQWGADESRRNCEPTYSPEVTHGVLHHTAGSNDYSRAEAASVVNGIYAYHTDVRGWCDIGYNLLVDRYGTIYEGRYGGLDQAVRGAHAGGFNANTVGIAMIGHHDLAGVSAATRHALADAFAWRFELDGIDPRGEDTLTSAGGGTSRYPAGTTVTMPTLLGHGDVGHTSCPGDHGEDLLPLLREDTGALMSSTAFVQALYEDLLRRPADPGGAAYWSGIAQERGKHRTIRGIGASAEHRTRVVEAAYERILGRPADPGGLRWHSDQIRQGRLTVDAVEQRLLRSREFWNSSGGTAEGFVAALYQVVLGRPADPGGASSWVDYTNRHGRAATVGGVWRSNEATTRRVADMYQSYLGRGLDPGAARSWVPLARQHGDGWVRDRILLSREYQYRADARF